MGILLKALIKSLIDKKARTIIVLFSIAVSASLMFANECFSQVCKEKFYQADVRHSGNSDLCIQTKESVGAKEWIDPQSLSKYSDQFKYNYQFIQEKALYLPSIEKMHYFTMIGANIGEFNSYNPLTLSKGSFQDWNGFKAVIGTVYAKKYGIKVNDMIKLELNGRKYSFKVIGISAAKGLFTRELADGGYILAPKDTIARIYNGGANLAYIKLKDSSQKKSFKERLTKELAEYRVDYGVNDDLISAETNNYVIPFRISAIAVIFMSIFIIFTAFNLITLERIPLIGTLRSIGSTRKRINRLLIAESTILGVIGGLIGCIMGIGVLRIIIYIYFKDDSAALTSAVLFSPKAICSALLIAALITVASSIVPILGITKIPIKNIILNDVYKKQGKRSKLWVAGCILMIVCCIIPHSLGTSFTDMIIGNIAATGALIAMIPLVPLLTGQISKLLGKIPFLSYNIVLGAKNVRDNRSLINNIQLFSAAIAIVAFMSSIFNSMYSDMIKAYETDTKFDIQMSLRHSDAQTISRIAGIKGVKNCIGEYMTDADIVNHNTFFNMLYGITDDQFFNYRIVKQLGLNKKALAALNEGKNIITTNILKDKLGLKIGDKLLIRFGSKDINYTITGFVETNLGIGHVGYISADNYRQDMGVSDYSSILIQTKSDRAKVKNNIQRALTKNITDIQTKDELLTANSDKVVPMFKAISVYSYIALLIGLIGIINNLGASFLERKSKFGVLRSLGMSRKGLNKMLTAEAIFMGAYGIIFGLATAIIMSSAIPSIVSIFWGNVTVALAVKQMVLMGVVGILAMLLIASVPVVKSNRLSIIESIKYE